MKFNAEISRLHLKENNFAKANTKKIRKTATDKSDSALVSQLLYNFLFKEGNKNE